MDAEFVRERITRLRIEKGVSEYKMSYDLGHSRGYIYNISSGKTLPSMAEFFAICDYFGITPAEFFNEQDASPVLIKNVLEKLQRLNAKDAELLLLIAERLGKY